MRAAHLPLLCLTAFPTLAQDVVKLPAGVTPLAEIGIYHVAWQSYNGPVVDMPPSWLGHFEDASGISYQPGQRVLGRDTILLHSPWRAAPGKVWVDYRLALPDIAPLEFRTGITMAPDVAVPGKSDGVTFSAFVEGRELIRQHHDQGEWRDYTFDLAAWRGKTITLRLQCEPGPANSPSFDFSYWGEPRIIAGEGQASIARELQTITASKAYQAVDNVDLRQVANRPGGGIEPSMLLPHQTSLKADGDSWVFTSRSADATVVYRYTPETGTLDDWTVQVDGGVVMQPMAGGGVLCGSSSPTWQRETVTGDPATGVLKAVWSTAAPKSPGAAGLSLIKVAWTWRLADKALVVEAQADGPGASGLSLGGLAGAPLRRTIAVPYLPSDWSPGTLLWIPSEPLYVNRYLDWTRSHGSRCPQTASSYDTTTAGHLNPLYDTGYVCVSPSLPEVLPNIPWPASKYLDLLGPRIMLDIWGHQPGGLAGDAKLMYELKDQGVDHVAIIQHVWQRYGYDVKLPDHIPTNPGVGGDEGMIAFGKAANACGYVWSVHENYIDLYPDAPSYDASARVLTQSGEPSKAWFNKGTGVQSYGLKCDRALGYAQQNSPIIHQRYATNSAYLDVHTCVPPWHQLDHDATAPMAAMSLLKVQEDAELFDYMRATHEGPLFGEGANHFYWAGQVDGVEAQVRGGEHHAPLLDLDLLKLHPQMVNHGMGYYERWFARGYNHQWGRDTGTVEQVDKYRAQELAYGHAGFVGGAQVGNAQWVIKEHHLMHPVQALYGNAKVTDLRYFVDGQWVTGSAAVALGQTERQRIRYDSGLVLYVNWSPEAWTVAGRTLPQWGWLAEGPQTTASTFLLDGKFADYVDCPEYVFADARTSFTMPYRKAGPTIEPRLRSFKYLGEGKAQVTYEWRVGEGTKLDEDFQCFVHFSNDGTQGTDDIVGQQDHALPRPTSQWRAGEVIVDGPYTIDLPRNHDTLKLLIGLYGGPRLPLKGYDDGGSRILLGTLHLTYEGETIAEVAVTPPPAPNDADEADFAAHLNPAGTWLDFGPVATNGSVKIERHGNSLLVIPYPRGQAFDLELELGKLSPGAAVATAKVVALAVGTRAVIGPVKSEVRGSRLRFSTATEGAGCYEITW